MANQPMTDAVIKEAISLVKEHGSITAAARASGIPRTTLSDRYRHRGNFDSDSDEERARGDYLRAQATPKPLIGERIDIDENRSKGTLHLFVLSADKKRIETPEDAMAKANIDTDIWEIDRIQIKSYEQGCKIETTDAKGHKSVIGVAVTPMFGMTLWLKRIKMDVQLLAFKALVEDIKNTPISVPKIKRPKLTADDRYLFEISLADMHFGKLAWKPEVLEDYDLEIAERRYLAAQNDLLVGIQSYPVEEILMIVGNDHFHLNNADNTTARGTSQDVDGRWQKVFRVGKMATIKAIEMARAVAPVNVMIVPGNHDPEWCFFLGEVLAERYRDAKDITVDNRPLFRKYKHYGQSLIGFTHGDKEKMQSLPLTMAREMKKQWADSTYYEIHMGHLHKRAEHKFVAGDTYNGVTVRHLPSLTGTDAWHHTSGYTGSIKSSDAYLWHKSRGLSRVFVVNSLEEDVQSPDAS